MFHAEVGGFHGSDSVELQEKPDACGPCGSYWKIVNPQDIAACTAIMKEGCQFSDCTCGGYSGLEPHFVPGGGPCDISFYIAYSVKEY
jgi:hypothetical protein